MSNPTTPSASSPSPFFQILRKKCCPAALPLQRDDDDRTVSTGTYVSGSLYPARRKPPPVMQQANVIVKMKIALSFLQVWVCVPVCACLCDRSVLLGVCACVCLCVPVCACVCMSCLCDRSVLLGVCVLVCACVCRFFCLFVCACVFMCDRSVLLGVCACVCLCVHVCLSVCASVCVTVLSFLQGCVPVCVCMCCVRMSVCGLCVDISCLWVTDIGVRLCVHVRVVCVGRGAR